MAAVLVSLAQGKAHLRITTPALDPGDLDIQMKLDQSEAAILDYLSTGVDAAWVSPETVHPNVSAAILILLANLYENRGDDESFGMGGRSDAVWAAIDRLLVRFRVSAIA